MLRRSLFLLLLMKMFLVLLCMMLLVQTFQTTLYLLPGDDDGNDDDISTDESPEEKEVNVDTLATSLRIVVDDEVLKIRPCRLRQSSIPFAIHAEFATYPSTTNDAHLCIGFV